MGNIIYWYNNYESLNFDPGNIIFLELILMSCSHESVLLSRNGFDAIYITPQKARKFPRLFEVNNMKLVCSAISKFLASYCSPAYACLYPLADIIEIKFMKPFLYYDEYDVDFTASITICIT